MTQSPVCVVAGVGPGIGEACCERYAAEGYQVIMMARSRGYLEQLSRRMPDTARAIAVDLTDEVEVSKEFSQLIAELGRIDVLIYNAARGSFGGFLEVEPLQLEKNFAVNTMGLLYSARAVAPAMIERSAGSIIVTGNTAATRGSAKFATFAPSKSAARSLTQSMARELGPQHVHVAYLVIDAAVDGPFAREMQPDKPDDFFIQPAAIADAVWYLDQQPENCWTSELDLRPHAESW